MPISKHLFPTLIAKCYFLYVLNDFIPLFQPEAYCFQASSRYKTTKFFFMQNLRNGQFSITA